MDNLRIRSAVTALFFGVLGLDMLSLEPHQQKLFLFLGGPLLAIAVGCGVLSFTHNGSWAIVSGAALVFLQFWALARFFEALSHTDESFQRLLDTSNRPAGELTDQAGQRAGLGARPSA